MRENKSIRTYKVGRTLYTGILFGTLSTSSFAENFDRAKRSTVGVLPETLHFLATRRYDGTIGCEPMYSTTSVITVGTGRADPLGLPKSPVIKSWQVMAT